ncbi:MAG: ABC transporter permease [Chloroflexi bacterium]|nr:ABC transporter permease [Chloroflexota bacterium]
MDTKRIGILARRVINQMLADRRTLALMIVVPVILLSFLGILIRSDNAELKVGVVNNDAGMGPVNFGDSLVSVLEDFDEFDVETMTTSEARDQLDDGDVDAVITVPVSFSTMIAEEKQLNMNVEYEGSNPILADRLEEMFERASLQAAVRTVNQLQSAATMGTAGTALASTEDFETTIDATYLHTGPEYDTLDYMAPALIGFFVFFFLFLLTCISFLRERVAGTLERLQATPIRSAEVILGYMGGFLVFGLLQGALVLLFTVLVLGIHYEGNLLNIFVVEALLVALSVNIGIFLSTFAQNEFQVLQFVPLVVVTQGLLGGVIWEIEDMPDWIQPISKVMPLTYANDALRGVMLKGDSLLDVWYPLTILLLFVAGVIFLSARTAGRAKI